MLLCLVEGLSHHCPGGGRMVLEPLLKEHLLLGGIGPVAFIGHRIGDLKLAIQSTT